MPTAATATPPRAVTRSVAEGVAQRVVRHFRAAQRDLPWRRTSDPYAVWVSEIMLQQTRVATVVPYYRRWMERFPTVRALAGAPLDDVLAAWSGLGYYSRARNLHRAAQVVVERMDGVVPASANGLRGLPGIGPYTAGAIASIAFGLPEPVVDGNVARVLARLFAVDHDVKSSRGSRVLWQLARELVPAESPGDYNQGLMELGATVCTPTRPSCLLCPVGDLCLARASGRQAELPITPGRKATSELPRLVTHALWIERRGRVLLARRAPRGLYGGLWELPASEDPGQLEALLPARVTLRGLDPVFEHSQFLSHRRLTIRVLAAAVRGPVVTGADAGWPPEASYDALAWHGHASLATLGVSAATRAIVSRLLRPTPRQAPGDVP